jgi:hypothetical protein
MVALTWLKGGVDVPSFGRGWNYFVKASGPKRIRITSASASMTFDCVLRSFCSALSPTTPSAATNNVIARISGTAVGVYLGENFASLTLGKDRSSIATPSLVGKWRQSYAA